jgi:hypothetical protein
MVVVVVDAWLNGSNYVGEGLTKLGLNRQKPERAELLESIETPASPRVANAVEPRREARLATDRWTVGAGRWTLKVEGEREHSFNNNTKGSRGIA